RDDEALSRSAFPWRSAIGECNQGSCSHSPDGPAIGRANLSDSPDYPGIRRLGGLSDGPNWALGLVGDLELRLQRVANGALGDDAAFDLRPGRDLEHRVEQRFLDDRLQGARAGAAQQSELRDRVE